MRGPAQLPPAAAPTPHPGALGLVSRGDVRIWAGLVGGEGRNGLLGALPWPRNSGVPSFPANCWTLEPHERVGNVSQAAPEPLLRGISKSGVFWFFSTRGLVVNLIPGAAE